MRRFSFYYPDVSIQQEKILIRHEDYLTLKVLATDSNKEVKRKEKAFKELTGGEEWFTDISPLYDAISTGILDCNGIYPCIVKEII